MPAAILEGSIINDINIVNSVKQSIIECFTISAINGFDAALSTTNSYVHNLWPGQSLNEADFLNPWSPDKQTGSQLSIENISILVNQVPNIGSQYNPSGVTVEQAYELILMANYQQNNQTTTNSSPSPGQGPIRVPIINSNINIKNIQKLKNATSIQEKLVLLGKKPNQNNAIKNINQLPVEFIQQFKQSYELQQYQSNYANLSASININKKTDPEKINQLKTNQQNYNKMLANLDNPSLNKLGIMSKNNVLLSNIINNNNDLSSNPVLNLFNKANQIFQSTYLASINNPGLTYHPSYVTPSNFANSQDSSTWPKIDKLPIKASNGNNYKISMQFCRVDIIRPWLNSLLFSLPNWYVMGQNPGSFSNGILQNNTGLFSLLPTYFIVARNITLIDDNNNTCYDSSGLQILAWISKINPFMPPN